MVHKVCVCVGGGGELLSRRGVGEREARGGGSRETYVMSIKSSLIVLKERNEL